MYDIQKLRTATGNRIVRQYKARLGLEPGDKEEDDAEAAEILDAIRAAYDKITEGIVGLPKPKKFDPSAEIATYAELVLCDVWVHLADQEHQIYKQIAAELSSHPIWTQWLEGVKGVGPAMAGVLISEIDISRAKYPSSLHRLAGLDTGPDGRGRSRRAEHLVDVTYKNAKGEEATRKSITYNPLLKTKLMGVLAGSFLKCGDRSPYSKIYKDYKHRYENHAEYKTHSKGHRHAMAMRAMMKIFLCHLYNRWRAIEGLEVHPPYAVAKLGMPPHGQK